jgi:inositol phosphorylceramide mannosyltransferase catalytic subunit
MPSAYTIGVWVAVVLLMIAIGVILAFYINVYSPGGDAQIATVKAFFSSECNPHKCNAFVEQKVPKVIYRIALGGLVIGPGTPAWDNTAKSNPEYTQVVFNDAQANAFMFTALEGEAYEAYNRLVPLAAKADLLRYCLMYERGGVYLDHKSSADKLCTLIRPDDTMIVSTWPMLLLGMSEYRPTYGELQNWWLIAAPGHPMFKRTIQAVVREVNERAARQRPTNLVEEVLKLTGPLQFSRAVDLSRSDVRLVCSNGNGVMHYDANGGHRSGKSYSGNGYLLK